MSNQIFRKVSLDRLSSPEQLDHVMQVTTPRGWIALAAIGCLLATGVAWSVLGSVAEKVDGRGILVKSGGVLEVVASAEGRVADVSVAVGDSVAEGQVVAWVSQPELSDHLQEAKTRLAALRQEYARRTGFSEADTRLQGRRLAQRRAGLEQSIEAGEKSVQSLSERLVSQEQLVSQGLMTRSTLLATRQQYEQSREKVHGARGELAEVAVQQLALENRRRETLGEGEIKIEAARNDVAKADRELRAASQIVSPYTGRILEVMTEQGKVVGRGEPVLSLDLTGRSVRNLVAVMYVPSVHGKKVRAGMEIQIAPSTVRREEYGMMLGKVTFVSDFPATPNGMRRSLKNEQLVGELSGGGAPYEVHADLTVDPATASQYRWSSSKGPPLAIQSGTTVTGSIRVETQRPIVLVIPILRRWTGM